MATRAIATAEPSNRSLSNPASGLTWDGERFGTVATGLFFTSLLPESAEAGGLVALQGIEPWFDG
jgi:hypothetical protein